MIIPCKKCKTGTDHVEVPNPKQHQRGVFRCAVCGTERYYAKDFGAGDFPELTHDENETIHAARIHGFAPCFPAFPDAKTQARQTLLAARKSLNMPLRKKDVQWLKAMRRRDGKETR